LVFRLIFFIRIACIPLKPPTLDIFLKCLDFCAACFTLTACSAWNASRSSGDIASSAAASAASFCARSSSRAFFIAPKPLCFPFARETAAMPPKEIPLDLNEGDSSAASGAAAPPPTLASSATVAVT
jgi:hypothetical protein